MYLTKRKMRLLEEVLSALSEPLSEHEVRARLGRAMLGLFDAQYYVSYVWDGDSKRFSSRQSLNMDPENLRMYESYYQFRDPITTKMQQHRSSVRATDVMPHDELRKTEFFNDFLARDGLYWGVNLYAWDDGENIGDIRIWRDSRGENFSPDELQLLDVIRAPFLATLKRCRTDGGRNSAMFSTVQGRLSGREFEIAELVSLGMSDKEISRKMGISLPTVRTHLRNLFRKLGVDSRIKLVRIMGV